MQFAQFSKVINEHKTSTLRECAARTCQLHQYCGTKTCRFIFDSTLSNCVLFWLFSFRFYYFRHRDI